MKSLPSLVCFLVLSAFTFSMQSAHAAKITNKQVVELVKAGLPDAIVIQAIESGEPNFDTSAAAIGAMKKQGVGDAIIQRMVLRQFGGSATPATPVSKQPQNAPAPQTGGACKFDPSDLSQPIQDGENKVIGLYKDAEQSQSVNTGSVLASVFTLGLVSAKASGSIGLPGVRADIRLRNGNPIFKEIYAVDDTGTSDMVKLVKFETRGGKREFELVTAEQGLLKAESKSNLNQMVKLKFVPTGVTCQGTSKHQGRRFVEFEAQPMQPLVAGEYGLLVGDKVMDFGID